MLRNVSGLPKEYTISEARQRVRQWFAFCVFTVVHVVDHVVNPTTMRSVIARHNNVRCALLKCRGNLSSTT